MSTSFNIMRCNRVQATSHISFHTFNSNPELATEFMA